MTREPIANLIGSMTDAQWTRTLPKTRLSPEAPWVKAAYLVLVKGWVIPKARKQFNLERQNVDQPVRQIWEKWEEGR